MRLQGLGTVSQEFLGALTSPPVSQPVDLVWGEPQASLPTTSSALCCQEDTEWEKLNNSTLLPHIHHAQT